MAARESPSPAPIDARRRVSRRIAGAYFLFAATWIVVSDLALFELTKELPSFAGASLIKGGAFVLVTTALLYHFIAYSLRDTADSSPLALGAAVPRLARLNPAIAFGLSAILAIVLVAAMYSYESHEHRTTARQQLSAILELKADQIELLLSQRQATARSYSQSRGLRDDLTQLMQGTDSRIVSNIADRIENLRHDLEFDAVLVLDASGQAVAGSGPAELRRLSPEFTEQAMRSLASGLPVSHFLHRDAPSPGNPVLIDYITPLSGIAEQSQIVGAIVLRENARGRLFRLIQDWPTPSPTAESLLVRRDRDAVQFLNDVRHAKDTAFQLRLPLSDTSVIAAKVVTATGSVLTEGKDYRGVSVVAASRAIIGTDWFLIAKVDQHEVLAPVRKSAVIWLGLILGMSLLSGIGVVVLWRQQLRLVAANELVEAAGRERAENRLSAAEERYRALFERSLDCIFLADLEGNFLEANHAALDLLGYRREEIPSISYRTLIEPADLPRAFAALKEVIRTGTQREANEYTLRRKDGREVTVESKTALVYDDGKPAAILGIARDVTERKRAQRELEFRNTVLLTQQETSPDAVLLVDEGNRIASYNRRFLEMWNIPEALARAGDDEPVLNSVVGQMQNPEEFIKQIKYLYDNKGEKSQDELHTRDGRIIDRNSAPAIGPGGEYFGRVWYFRDITERRRAEEALHENRERLRLLIEHAPAALAMFDREMRYLTASRRWMDDYLLGDREIIGHTHYEIFPEIPERWKDIHRRGLAGEVIKADADRFERLNGTVQLLRWEVRPWYGSDGTIGGIILFTEDITERERAKAALSQSETRFRQMADTIGEVFWMAPPDLSSMTYVSPGFEKTWGWAPAELYADPGLWIKAIHPEDVPLVEAGLARLAQGGSYDIEFRITRRDGTLRWINDRGYAMRDDTGRIVLTTGVATDITDRKRSELESRESEQRFRAMIEQSISGFYLIQDGKFSYVNSRFAEIFGYASPGEIVGKPPSELVAAKDRATVSGNIQRRLAGEVKSISYSFTGVRKDGTEIEVGVHGSFAIYQGRPVIMGLLQDISERKRAEDQIRNYVARLEQAMQSTINVVATIGELRDPYTHGHERRVGEIAAAIAEEMGLPASQTEGIRIAGYLHDVGKIGVPAEILSKPGKLTKAEYDLVKDHAQQSYEILKNVQFPWPVAEAAWQHHERFDGSGYPRGLKGEDIITEARILAVADTVEAMSSHRPYRPGLGIDQALAEVEKSRGRLYCPQAVDACLRLFREKGYTLPA